MSMLRIELLEDGATTPAVSIQAGEAIDLDLDWGDASMAGASVVVKVMDSSSPSRVLYQQTLSDQSHLTIPGSTTQAWEPKKNYRTEVWLTQSGASRSGAFQVRVN